MRGEARRKDQASGELTSSVRSGPSVNSLKGSFVPISHVKRIDIRLGRSYSEIVGVWCPLLFASALIPCFTCACVRLTRKTLGMTCPDIMPS